MKTKTKLLPEISERTAVLISQGQKTVGADCYSYIEESLYINEAESVKMFCDWIEKNHHRASREMPFIESNLRNLYKNYFLKEQNENN